MKQPDKLFREKLENHSTPAPEIVWQRIELAQPTKNKTVFWLKIAASIVLLLSVSILLWRPAPQIETIAETSVEDKKATRIESTSPKSKSEVKTKIKADKKSKTVIYNLRIQHNKNLITENNSNQGVEVDNNTLVTELLEANNTIVSEEGVAVAAENNTTNTSSTTIIYTAAEVNEKYLRPVVVADATSEEIKTSTFQKLLEKASDLKNNQAPLAELRQKKNELLALNFKNERREQNN